MFYPQVRPTCSDVGRLLEFLVYMFTPGVGLYKHFDSGASFYYLNRIKHDLWKCSYI